MTEIESPATERAHADVTGRAPETDELRAAAPRTRCRIRTAPQQAP